MIDLDLMEERLAMALTADAGRSAPPRPSPPPPVPPPAWAPAEAATTARRSRGQRRTGRAADRPGPVPTVAELVELGRLEEVDDRVAGTTDRRDAVTWTTMRALLAGERDAVSSGVGELLALARANDDPEALERHWTQRFWAAVEWGTDGERLEVLDHCRERAYRFDEPGWWGNVALLLAVMGKHDEAARACDDARARAGGMPRDALQVDVVTNVIEAAALLEDPGRVVAASRLLRVPEDRLVAVGPASVCKGSVERYRALGHAAAGRWSAAEACFRAAESLHRAIGAGPLLARTLRQGSGRGLAA